MLFCRVEVRLRPASCCDRASEGDSDGDGADERGECDVAPRGARSIPRRQQSRRESDQEVLGTDSGGKREKRGTDQIRIGVAASSEETRDREDDQHERRDVAERAASEEPDVRKKSTERGGDRGGDEWQSQFAR